MIKKQFINITMNTLNEYNDKYMIYEQFIKFFNLYHLQILILKNWNNHWNNNILLSYCLKFGLKNKLIQTIIKYENLSDCQNLWMIIRNDVYLFVTSYKRERDIMKIHLVFFLHSTFLWIFLFISLFLFFHFTTCYCWDIRNV